MIWLPSRRCTDPFQVPALGPFLLSSAKPPPSQMDNSQSQTHPQPWLKREGLTQIGIPGPLADYIINGVQLGFHQLPQPASIPNYASLAEFKSEVGNELERLIAMGRLVGPLREAPTVICPLGVVVKTRPDKSLKVRMTFDATAGGVNDALTCPGFNLPTIEDALDRIAPGDFLTSFDMRDGYLHIPVDPRESKFLGCRHPISGALYKFTYLPFGIATCPIIFCAFTGLIARHLRTLDPHTEVLVYLDDFFAIGRTRRAAVNFAFNFERLADIAGLKLAHEKRHGPSTEGTFLGFCVDTVSRTLSLPIDKWEKIKQDLAEVLANPNPQVRILLSVAGKLGHISKVVRGGRLHLNEIWNLTSRAERFQNRPWHSVKLTALKVTPALRGQLQWWSDRLASRPIRKLWVKDNGKLSLWDPSRTAFMAVDSSCAVVFTDARKNASEASWGGSWGNRAACGHFPAPECSWDISALELLAVSYTLAAFHDIQQQRVLVFTDNMATSIAINKRNSASPFLRTGIQRLQDWEESTKCEVIAAFLPGAINNGADALSRSGVTDCSTLEISRPFTDLIPEGTSIIVAAGSSVKPPLLIPEPLTVIDPWKSLISSSKTSSWFPQAAVSAKYRNGRIKHPRCDWILVPGHNSTFRQHD